MHVKFPRLNLNKYYHIVFCIGWLFLVALYDLKSERFPSNIAKNTLNFWCKNGVLLRLITKNAMFENKTIHT